MYYVYVLKSHKDRQMYIGYTVDLRRRIKEHESGHVQSTKGRLPVELVYYEAFKYVRDAKAQELFYKTGQGRRILKARLKTVMEGCESG